MVAVSGARLPCRTLLGKSRGERAGAGQVTEPEWLIDHRQPCLMGEHLMDGDLALAGCGELGPIGRHTLIVVEQTACVQHRERHCCHTLGRREDRHYRFRPPGDTIAAVPVAAPEVHDLPPAPVDGAGSADLVTRGEVLAKGVGHCAVAFIHVTANHAVWYIELEDHYFPFISTGSQPGAWDDLLVWIRGVAVARREIGLAVRRVHAAINREVRAVDARGSGAGEKRHDSGYLGGIAGSAHGHAVVEPVAQRRAIGERCPDLLAARRHTGMNLVDPSLPAVFEAIALVRLATAPLAAM